MHEQLPNVTWRISLGTALSVAVFAFESAVMRRVSRWGETATRLLSLLLLTGTHESVAFKVQCMLACNLNA